MGIAFQVLAPWYLINFWHSEKENLGINRFFLVVDLVRRLWVEEIGENKRGDTGKKKLNYLSILIKSYIDAATSVIAINGFWCFLFLNYGET